MFEEEWPGTEVKVDIDNNQKLKQRNLCFLKYGKWDSSTEWTAFSVL